MGQENERTSSLRVVDCPNCGARECIEYRPNAFQCRFCKSKYRVSQPQQDRSSHRSDCHCGKQSIGSCTSCQQGVCEDHHLEWGDLLWSWTALKVNYVGSNKEASKETGRRSQEAAKVGGLSEIDLIRQPGWLYRDAKSVMQRMQEYQRHRQEYGPSSQSVYDFGGRDFSESLLRIWGITSDELGNLLCPGCLESHFAASVRQVETLVQETLRRGDFCGRCEDRERQSREQAWSVASNGYYEGIAKHPGGLESYFNGLESAKWIEFLNSHPFPRTSQGTCCICELPVCSLDSSECEHCNKKRCKVHELAKCPTCPRRRKSWNLERRNLWPSVIAFGSLTYFITAVAIIVLKFFWLREANPHLRVDDAIIDSLWSHSILLFSSMISFAFFVIGSNMLYGSHQE